MYDSREMVIPEEGECPESTSQDYNVVEGKHATGSVKMDAELNNKGRVYPQSSDDAGVIVEELTLENYNGGYFAGPDPSNDLQNNSQSVHKLHAGSGSRSATESEMQEENCHGSGGVWEEVDYSSLSKFLMQKPSHHDVVGQETTIDFKADSRNGGIRTKIMSSGFSQFFVKNTLKGKGVIRRSDSPIAVRPELTDQINTAVNEKATVAANTSVSFTVRSSGPSYQATAEVEVVSDCSSFNSGITLRDWLTSRYLKVKKFERLYIFRQIVDIVNHFHLQGIPIPDLCPSCFRVLSSSQIHYIGSLSRKDMKGTVRDNFQPDNQNNKRRHFVEDSGKVCVKKSKHTEGSNVKGWWLQQSLRSDVQESSFDLGIHGTGDHVHGFRLETSKLNLQDKLGNPMKSSTVSWQLTQKSDPVEEKWYTSPEEGSCTLLANIYCLGVMFFELLCYFDSEEAHTTAMFNLRQRIFPPSFLAEYPKEVWFCLWLLHPEPSARPSIGEILQAETYKEWHNLYGEEFSSSIESESIESDLLSHFLVIAKEEKEKASLKLAEDLRMLEADIHEIEVRQSGKNIKPDFCLERGPLALRERTTTFPQMCRSYLGKSDSVPSISDSKLIKNLRQLENAYFSTRQNIQLPESESTSRPGSDLLNIKEAELHKDGTQKAKADCMGIFFDGLCKYARYRKFEVQGVMRGPDLNSANVICSLTFDRDQDYFAAAGVSKRIKIFEYQSFFNSSVDRHYPVTEMVNKSKLSCVCWNPYIKNYLASSDYDGIIKLWDAATGTEFLEYKEHRKRAWSVDFSQPDPTKLASGSDDYSVKLWSVTQRNCLGTIKSHANVCSVQFSPNNSNLLAFGCSDFKAYCYDIRYPLLPWCTLSGHGKAVSNLKFVDSKTIISASTDNTLKLWDLNKTTSDGESINACSVTFSGHTNEKNFVGLSVSDGYIACGSETNEVYTYYKSLPVPITTHKFDSIDPISGKEASEDSGHFVSSVCWRRKSDTMIAANSTGCIKVLQLV